MKNNKIIAFIIAMMTLTGCSSTLISPCENQGLEGNAEQDTIETGSIENLYNILREAAKKEKYSYEVTSTVKGNQSHFINYVTNNAWYEENDDESLSFGYAMTKDKHEIFKYYLGENNKIIPSVYEYSESGEGNMTKITELYSAVTLTHIVLVRNYLSDLEAVQTSLNKYAITNSDIASVFQFMSSYGYSLMDYITSVTIEIIDLDSTIFKSVIQVGEYGAITGVFTPLKETPIDHVDKAASEGSLVGIDAHDDVATFFNKTKSNNFVLEGIKQNLSTGVISSYPRTIYCTNDYFYVSYNEGYESYINWGFVLVPKGTEITYEKQVTTDGVNYTTKTFKQTLHYDACYQFEQKDDDTFHFTDFVGPIETSSTKYLEVNELPSTGSTDTVYILVNEDGTKSIYEWIEGSGFAGGSSWINSVGDIYINDISATFYLSGTPLSAIGAYYFEKDLNKENVYNSADSDVMSYIANGLFGWGFSETTTWMSYVTNSYLEILKDGNEVTGANVGLEVTANVGNNKYETQQIYYTMKDFGKGNVAEIDAFLEGII